MFLAATTTTQSCTFALQSTFQATWDTWASCQQTASLSSMQEQENENPYLMQLSQDCTTIVMNYVCSQWFYLTKLNECLIKQSSNCERQISWWTMGLLSFTSEVKLCNMFLNATGLCFASLPLISLSFIYKIKVQMMTFLENRVAPIFHNLI